MPHLSMCPVLLRALPLAPNLDPNHQQDEEDDQCGHHPNPHPQPSHTHSKPILLAHYLQLSYLKQ